MAYDNPSFLDSEQEHKRWHKGLYTGLKTIDPRKIRGELKVTDLGFSIWYSEDEHYHDFAMLAAYVGKAGALAGGATLLAQVGLAP